MVDATALTGTIRSTRGGLEINGNNVPLTDVAVILLGNKATISGGAMTMLAKYDIILLNCDWRGVPDLVAYPWIDNSRVAARHRYQAELSQPRRKNAWQQIVRSKIEGQENNLTAASLPAAQRLRVIRKSVRSGDPDNREGQAARAYWQVYFGEDSQFQRVPGSADRLNAMLNYGYTIMRGFVIQAISASGLWPTYGIWHRNRSNSFALADDLIEPFRPAVDFIVQNLDTDASLEIPTVKKQLVSVLSMPMNGLGGSTVATSIYELAAQLAYYIENDRDRLEPAVWVPPQDSPRLE
ncbi:type II CRISPR-associated endonuclease Cas1 [Gulosibacter sp. 10]|uniref:type II CRISPR-associated endonuclease Cas1 n=1 Tax=Gulosibacter sp. 10 TaxID=1255570 RepID=UPI001595E7E6|nr:type II CRISPR-associated endonuclease Cas1 [Gulosibacter sp. 10]